MIKKLQKKFIMITIGSLALVIVIFVGSINIINVYQMNRRIDGTIMLLSENKGQFPKFEREKPPMREPKSGFQMNAETQFETRYFIVTLNDDKSIRQIDTSHIAAVSSSDAEEYTKKAVKSGRNSGYQGIYKYSIVNQHGEYMLVFVDCRNQIQTATIFLATSAGVGLAILVLVSILVSVFSRKAIKPIIESTEKQKQFITDAGHEIKTPLAIISANTDVLEMFNGENEWTASIRNQTIRLDKLVKNLLMLSKMDESSIKLTFSDFNLSNTVFNAASPFETIAAAQNKSFNIDIQPELKFHGDEGSIHQLVSTIVDNAVKYANEKGKISISLHSFKKGIKLEVYNTLDQIETGNLDKLFDRFYRADSSRSRDTGGYGIGLSVAKSIAEAHNCKISARSDDGKSICFTVQFNI